VTGESRIIDSVEAVFKALSDAHRRQLLDRLYERDGQTLSELETWLPEMTRFGVMKHLRVLEAAGLVVTRRVGREKLHYLNPMPIRLIQDRWISKYALPWVRAMGDLKAALEETTMTAPTHVYELYIKTTPGKLWRAIVSSGFTKLYFGGSVESDWRAGSTYRYANNEGGSMHFGTILEADPPRRLVQTFEHDISEEHGGGPDDVSKVTWEIAPMGEVCKLTLLHEYKGDSKSYQSSGVGWPMILSGLKTLLETGERLPLS
jgi:uncharacterized protein YndB with AHSA1/START domain